MSRLRSLRKRMVALKRRLRKDLLRSQRKRKMLLRKSLKRRRSLKVEMTMMM